LDEVLSQFGLDLVKSKAARLQMLNARLKLNAERGINSVLVVDEAQAIENAKGFEELRLLTNFQLNDRYLLTIVLIGQPNSQAYGGNSPIEPTNYNPCASRSAHGRGNDVIHRVAHGSRDAADRCVYERSGSRDL
jgi:hypothetical protein